jgi:DNA-binding PadR family transcriptional regulator
MLMNNCKVISLYLHSRKWYEKKKPELQLKILKILSSMERLSKSQALKILEVRDHYWPEVSDAFDKLNARGFVEPIEKDTRKHGKPEILYRLTADGIAVLMIENPSPDRIWSLMLQYCYSRVENEEVAIQTIEDFYNFFSKRIFKFSSGHNSLIILDTVNDVCNGWLNRFRLLNPGEINESNNVDSTTAPARDLLNVLPILVHHPDITINDLSLRSGISRKALENAIISVTMPSDGNFLTRKIPLDIHYVSKFRQMFLEHCFIVSRDTEQGKKFKLSTLGMILFLTYVHRKYRSSPSFIKVLTEYYDAIALNYRTLLPLIFGKWSLLKKRLKYTAMDFSAILDKENRYRGKYSTSVILGGINEYYGSMKNVVRHNNLITKEIYNAGYNALQMVINENRTEKRKNKFKSHEIKTAFKNTAKVKPVFHKLYEIWQMMRYQEAEIYVKELFQRQQTSSPIEIYSRLVQDEITFVYYINLISRHHSLDLPFLEESFKNPERLDNPHEILTKILEEDHEIGRWFTNWMKDIGHYQNDVFEIITNFEKTKYFVFKDERIHPGEADWD